MALDLDWLESFAAFADELNFTRAAKRLGISQPALHAKVRKLGEALDATLYRRAGRGLVLTPSGEAVLLFARQTSERARAFEARIRGLSIDQPLVLSAGEGAYLYLLGPGIKRYLRSRSHRALRLVTRSAPGVLEAVRRGEAHLGVGVYNEPPDDLEHHLLRSVEHVAVLPHDHPLARRRSLPIAALFGESMILPPPGSRLRETVASAFAREGATIELAVEASGWASMLHFASLGLGCTVVNACCTIPRRMVGVPISDLPVLRYLVVHARRPDDAVAQLRETLIDAAP